MSQRGEGATPTPADDERMRKMIFLLVAAAVVVAAPFAAAVLVTVASLREDSARSLNGRPPGLLTAAARRLLCLRTSPGTGENPPPAEGPYRSHDDPQPSSDWADKTLTMPRS